MQSKLSSSTYNPLEQWLEEHVDVPWSETLADDSLSPGIEIPEDDMDAGEIELDFDMSL
jgi:hypothetical protein